MKSLLKKIFPESVLSLFRMRHENATYLRFSFWIKRKRQNFEQVMLSIFSSNRFLSNIYYTVLSSSFGREHQSVLKGRLNYLKRVKSKDNHSALLRRNIHRLEKGILMKPRKPIFALGYIGETVLSYKKLLSLSKTQAVDEGEIKWAHDVLDKYFSIVGQHEEIDRYKFIFKNLGAIPSSLKDKEKYIPYKRNEKLKQNIPSINQFLALTKYRRSVRWFKPKKVSRDLLDEAINCAIQAPSACNRLPYEFKIIDDDRLLKEISGLPMGTTGYSENIPCLVVVVGKLDAYYSERDRHVVYIDASLAVMSMIFALETMGLGSCCINWPDIEELEQKIEDNLCLEKQERVIMLVAVGYPDDEGLVAFSKKKALSKVRTYNLD